MGSMEQYVSVICDSDTQEEIRNHFQNHVKYIKRVLLLVDLVKWKHLYCTQSSQYVRLSKWRDQYGIKIVFVSKNMSVRNILVSNIFDKRNLVIIFVCNFYSKWRHYILHNRNLCTKKRTCYQWNLLRWILQFFFFFDLKLKNYEKNRFKPNSKPWLVNE